MIAGEINRIDGLTDLIVAVNTVGGPRVLVFESPAGAIKSQPEIFTLGHPVTALALGKFDGNAMNDLAVAAGDELVVIHARDRRLASSPEQRASCRRRVTVQKLGFALQALAAGDFTGAGPGIAALGADGQIHILEHALAENSLARRMSEPRLVRRPCRWPDQAKTASPQLGTALASPRQKSPEPKLCARPPAPMPRNGRRRTPFAFRQVSHRPRRVSSPRE